MKKSETYKKHMSAIAQRGSTEMTKTLKERFGIDARVEVYAKGCEINFHEFDKVGLYVVFEDYKLDVVQLAKLIEESPNAKKFMKIYCSQDGDETCPQDDESAWDWFRELRQYMELLDIWTDFYNDALEKECLQS